MRTFPGREPFLPVGAGIHHDIQQFLSREALLLDHERYDEWLALLARDVHYRTPVSFARAIGIESPAGAEYFEDDHRSLTSRIRQLTQSRIPSGGDSGLARTHLRRLITNIIVCPRSRDEYDVLSYLLITSHGQLHSGSWFLSAERYDQVRRAAQSFKIARREIVIDQRGAPPETIDLFL